MKFLRPAVKSGEFAVWVDRLMPGGDEWDPEIERNLRACDIFVLLVSANSMGSDYIIDKELEIAREREAKGEMYSSIRCCIESTPKAGLDRVQRLQSSSARREALSRLFAGRTQPAHDATPPTRSPGIAAAIAERKEAAAARGKPMVRAPAFVHISGLPETFYERLVGRDAELERLDEAWSDDRTNILSLVAEGGAGKSALVNEWLTRLQADNYRGADCVLGWSFYSQGSKERATAADEFLNWALAKLGVKVGTTSAIRQGRGDRRGADGAARAARARRRRAAAARAGTASGPTQGPGPARASAPFRRRAARERITA